MNTEPGTQPSQPASLGEHRVPDERLALIRPHVAMLAETAKSVGDRLPLEADVSDMIAVLEAEVS